MIKPAKLTPSLISGTTSAPCWRYNLTCGHEGTRPASEALRPACPQLLHSGRKPDKHPRHSICNLISDISRIVFRIHSDISTGQQHTQTRGRTWRRHVNKATLNTLAVCVRQLFLLHLSCPARVGDHVSSSFGYSYFIVTNAYAYLNAR